MNSTKMFAFLREQKAFTAFLSTLVVISTFSSVFYANSAHAEIYAFEQASDTLSDARATSSAIHVVKFAPGSYLPGTPNGAQPVTNGALATPFTITFNGFTNPAGSPVVAADITLAGATKVANAGACTVAPMEMYITGVTTGLTPVVSLSLCPNDSIAVGVSVTATIGGVTNKFTNPGVIGTRTVTIDAVGANHHKSDLLIAIVDNVHLSAVVDPIFNFAVAGVASGATPVVGYAATNIATLPSTIDFGTLASGTAKMGAQTLTVKSNSKNGFLVTVQTTSEFQSANGAIIDGLNVGGTIVTVPAAWTAPAGTLANDKTWGHIGLSSSQTGGSSNFTAADQWEGSFIQTIAPIMDGATVTDGSGVGADRGKASVYYKAQITDLQEAATDYKTDLIYVATPVF